VSAPDPGAGTCDEAGMICGMSTYLVIEWSAPEGNGEQTERAMDAVRAHIMLEHPQIRSTRLTRQFAGAMPHVAYRWEEEYADLTAVDELVGSPDCSAVWRPVNALATSGSQRQSIWSDPDVPPAG
jgi:hypothetical protein